MLLGLARPSPTAAGRLLISAMRAASLGPHAAAPGAASTPQLVSLRAFRPPPLSSSRCPWTPRRPLSTQFTLPTERAPATALAARAGAAPAVPAAARLDALFTHSPVLLLERSVGERIAADAELWGTGCFQGEVYPDLPFATTWRDLVQRLFNIKGVGQPPQPAALVAAAAHVPHAGSGELPAGGPGSSNGRDSEQPWFVATVAAQCRSRDQLRAFMLAAAGVDFTGDPKPGARPADALLFVSGSHPARSLPVAGRWLQTSFDLLTLAATMREQGYLPPSLSLWAVENPMTTPVARLAQKIDAGAEVVLTQPPLAWERAERWVQEADALGLADQAKLMVGIPMVSSAGNLDFWLRLCQVRDLPESEALLASFPRQGDLGKGAFEAALKRWNADLIQRVLDLPGVAGLHVMPLTKSARQMTADFLRDGTLPSAAVGQLEGSKRGEPQGEPAGGQAAS